MRLLKALCLALAALVLMVQPSFAQGDASAAKPGGAAETGAAQPPAAGDAAATGDAQTGAAAPAAGAEPAAEAAPADAPTSAAAPPATAAKTSTAAAPSMDGSTYVVRLRDLEQRIDELKEQIRRSHTRLSLLSDTILSGGVGGARAEITFKNELSSAFRLTRVLVVLDGAVQYNKQDDSGTLSEQQTIPIFSGSIPPGDHTVQVLVELRGHGYGVFSYLRGYRFEIKDSHSFTVTDGKTMNLEVVAFEKGGVTTPIEQRPAVRYLERLKTGAPAGQGSPSPAPSSSSAPAASGSFSVKAGGK